MPQVTNIHVYREMELSPVGPGTVFDHVIHISAAIRARARIINKIEESKLERARKIIHKEQIFVKNVQEKVIQRTSKCLKEKMGLQFLQIDSTFDKYITVQRHFNSYQIESKEMARKHVTGSRISYPGFSLLSLKPAAGRRLRKLDKNYQYESIKKILLDDCRGKNVEINRAVSNSAFYRMLGDKKHWRDYNLPDNKKLLPEYSQKGSFDKVKDENFDVHLKKYERVITQERENKQFKSMTCTKSDRETQTKQAVLSGQNCAPKTGTFHNNKVHGWSRVLPNHCQCKPSRFKESDIFQNTADPCRLGHPNTQWHIVAKK